MHVFYYVNLDVLTSTSHNSYACLFVCFSGRPPRGEVGVPWPQSLEFCLTSKGLAFSNAPFPGQAWGTNLVLLPYAGGQPNTTLAVI